MSTVAEISGLVIEADEEKRYFSRNNSFRLTSIMGYLIGVNKSNFEDPDNPAMRQEIYAKLNMNKGYRIIRNLSIVRTNIERHYPAIFEAFRNGHSITSIPELISVDAVNELLNDGIRLSHNKMDVNETLVEINREISNRVQVIKGLIPEWLEWDYIRELFIMPGGFKKEGLSKEGMYYAADNGRYPYGAYINWHLEGDFGNILYCDEKFVKLLYRAHETSFQGDDSLLRSASDETTDIVKKFFDSATNVFVAVDCENSNPIKVASLISTFPPEQKEKISEVALYDSSHTTAGWRVLSDNASDSASEEEYYSDEDDLFDWSLPGQISGVPMRHEMTGHIIYNKSQVDMTLAAGVFRAALVSGADAVILISSDCDYYPMISHLPEAKFLVMCEREKTSPATQEALFNAGVPYCFLDDFNTAVANNIKTLAVKTYVQQYLDSVVSTDAMDEVVKRACYNSWVEMTDTEQKNFFDRYIKKAHLELDSENRLRIVLGEK